MKSIKLMSLLAVVLLLAGCGHRPELEIRTFDIKHLDPGMAIQIIEPYVFDDREIAPGNYSLSGSTITVRETRDNLRRIAEILGRYDVEKPPVTLFIDVIEADGAGEVDEALEGILDDLEKLFRFQGYRRVASGVLPIMEGQEVSHRMGRFAGYSFEAYPRRMIQDQHDTWQIYMDMTLTKDGFHMLHTSATLRDAQTTLLGTSTDEEGIRAIILAIRPSFDY